LGGRWIFVAWQQEAVEEQLVMEESPADRIERHRVQLCGLDEAGFLAAVHGIPPLADSDSAIWDQVGSWDDAYRLIAAADVIGERGWIRGVVPVFERAARGDLYELMQDIRHGPERAAGAAELAALLEPLTKHERAGTRRWSVRELGILRQRSSLPPLADALRDDDEEVRREARTSLEMLGQVHPDSAYLVSRLPKMD
jgi:hypothetical protein